MQAFNDEFVCIYLLYLDDLHIHNTYIFYFFKITYTYINTGNKLY